MASDRFHAKVLQAPAHGWTGGRTAAHAAQTNLFDVAFGWLAAGDAHADLNRKV